MERVYSQGKDKLGGGAISQEKVKKKGEWGRIRHKQANKIHSAEIKNQIKAAL